MPRGVLEDGGHLEECWKAGDDRQWCGDYFAHFFWPEEIVALVRGAGVEVVECVGLEGLGSNYIEEVNRLARRQPERWRVWLAAHAALCTHPAVFAGSQHL